MQVNDVEDYEDKFIVSINCNKNDYPGQFIIGNLFYEKVKKYISFRPTGNFCDRFFIQYANGKCTRQAIGRHKIGDQPKRIATFLKLENPNKYTCHCFRRTAATLLSNSGANMQMLKQLGRWHSDIIAQGYVENSMHNRQLNFDGIVQETARNEIQHAAQNILPRQHTARINPPTSTFIPSNQHTAHKNPSTSSFIPSIPPSSLNQLATHNHLSVPSTSKQGSNVVSAAEKISHEVIESEVYELEWSDFSEELTIESTRDVSGKFSIFNCTSLYFKILLFFRCSTNRQFCDCK